MGDLMPDRGIEWVEIPAGEFTFGLSEEQSAEIRAQLWAELGPPADDQATTELLHRMIEQPDCATMQLYYERRGIDPKTPKMPSLEMQRDVNLVSLTRVLKLQNKQARVWLDRFLISRFPI